MTDLTRKEKIALECNLIDDLTALILEEDEGKRYAPSAIIKRLAAQKNIIRTDPNRHK